MAAGVYWLEKPLNLLLQSNSIIRLFDNLIKLLAHWWQNPNAWCLGSFASTRIGWFWFIFFFIQSCSLSWRRFRRQKLQILRALWRILSTRNIRVWNALDLVALSTLKGRLSSSSLYPGSCLKIFLMQDSALPNWGKSSRNWVTYALSKELNGRRCQTNCNFTWWSRSYNFTSNFLIFWSFFISMVYICIYMFWRFKGSVCTILIDITHGVISSMNSTF